MVRLSSQSDRKQAGGELFGKVLTKSTVLMGIVQPEGKGSRLASRLSKIRLLTPGSKAGDGLLRSQITARYSIRDRLAMGRMCMGVRMPVNRLVCVEVLGVMEVPRMMEVRRLTASQGMSMAMQAGPSTSNTTVDRASSPVASFRERSNFGREKEGMEQAKGLFRRIQRSDVENLSYRVVTCQTGKEFRRSLERFAGTN